MKWYSRLAIRHYWGKPKQAPSLVSSMVALSVCATGESFGVIF